MGFLPISLRRLRVRGRSEAQTVAVGVYKVHLAASPRHLVGRFGLARFRAGVPRGRNGSEIVEASEASFDGRYIVGGGYNAARGAWKPFYWTRVRCERDVNGDGCVDDSDLLQVLFAFGDTNRVRKVYDSKGS
jgi:hypothetical protein